MFSIFTKVKVLIYKINTLTLIIKYEFYTASLQLTSTFSRINDEL
jgi:hypothetical protein